MCRKNKIIVSIRSYFDKCWMVWISIEVKNVETYALVFYLFSELCGPGLISVSKLQWTLLHELYHSTTIYTEFSLLLLYLGSFWFLKKNLMIHLAILDQLLFAGKMNFFFHLSWWSKCVPYSQSFSHLKFCQSDSYLIIFFPLPVCTFTRLFTMVLDFIWLRTSLKYF